MSTDTRIETSDAQLLDLLRRHGSMSVSQMADAMHVTATAVRQRLTRLMAQGLVDRGLASASDGELDARAGRGRPSHRYVLTEKARRQAGNNFSDLAIVLWDEIRGVKDQEVRRGLLERIAGAMASMYSDRVRGSTLAARLEALRRLFGERRVPLDVDAEAASGDADPSLATEVTPLPMLTVAECPYPELAEKDRGICAVEKMLFSKLLETPVRLSQCRLDGHGCCQFETN